MYGSRTTQLSLFNIFVFFLKKNVCITITITLVNSLKLQQHE